jgi:hypothetical protein
LKAAGYDFAIRYVGGSASKDITFSEAQALHAAGLDIIIVFEGPANRILDGYAAGVSDAKTAVTQATAAGAPQTFFCYFACDFDAQASDQTAINAYLDGAASVLGGVNRVGFYGGSGAIKRVLDAGKATKAWQTSNFPGIKDSRIKLYQYAYHVTLPGDTSTNEFDKDEGYGDDLGQWSVSPAGLMIARPGANSNGCDGTAAASYTRSEAPVTANIVAIPPPVIASPALGGQAFRVSVTTVLGGNYTLEFKTSLTDPSWTAAQTSPGTGATITLTDGTATNSMRFYRVATQ